MFPFPIGFITGALPSCTVQAITGTLHRNKTLTGNYTFIQGTYPEGTSTFRWLSCATEGGSYSAIGGATSSTWLIPDDDSYETKYIKFEVTPVDRNGFKGIAVLSAAVLVKTQTLGTQAYTSGSGNWTSPAKADMEIYRVDVIGSGGGGGGGAYNAGSYKTGGGGGGGGAGQVTTNTTVFTISASTNYAYAVGVAGTLGAKGTSGHTAGYAGGDGNNSTFIVNGTTITGLHGHGTTNAGAVNGFWDTAAPAGWVGSYWGSGYPNGTRGVAGGSGEGTCYGGTGGNNGTAYGTGGNGGYGKHDVPRNGYAGVAGYVKIWYRYFE